MNIRAARVLDTRRERLLAHLAMLLFAALIAGSFTFGSWAVPYLAPAPLNALRFLIATALMGAFAFGPMRLKFSWPKAPWRFGAIGFFMAVYFVTMFIALTMTLPVATSAIFTLVPLMTAVTAFFIVGQRSGPMVILSLLLAAAGAIWVIFRADLGALLRLEIGRGEVIYFIGCVAYAFYTPLVRKLNRGEHPLILSFWSLFATTIWIAAWCLPELFTIDWLNLPPVVWGAVLYLAVGPTAIAFFLVQFASIRLPAAKVIAYGYLVPAFVIVIEGFVGHGWVGPGVVAGALVTVLGLVVLAFAREG